MAILYRHVRLDLNVPFYIGISKGNKRPYERFRKNQTWRNVVAKTNYRVDILFDDITIEQAKEKEKEFISLYGRRSRGGTLVNRTDGGDGALGIIFTEDAIRKMSEPNKGKRISEDHRKRVSEFFKGKPLSEEHKLKISKSHKGKNGRLATEETKAKMSVSAKKGKDNKATVLNTTKVIEIRALYDNKTYGMRKLAKMYGVTKNAISCIVHKKTWKYI